MVNNLLSSSVWATIGSVALAVLVLLVMITVHEFGHYIAGKILHFRINEFSIGFGPTLFSRTNKKSGEKFSLRLIPLGGYCAFEDEDESDETPSALTEKDAEEIFGERAKKVPMPEENAAPMPEEKDVPVRFCDQPPWKRIIVLLSGAAMNYVLALLVIFLTFFVFGQLSFVTYAVEPTQEIAAEYCFQDEDIILKANGKDIYMTTDLMSAVANRAEGEKVVFRVSRIEGDGRRETDVEIQLRCATNFENSADTGRLWEALGVAKVRGESGQIVTDGAGNPSYEIYTTSYRYGFWRTVGGGFVYSFRIAGSIFKALGELLTGALGVDSLGGPVTTIAVTSQVLSRGVRPFLEIVAYIGVNLAVFNLLPIPALDGSKVVFTLIEWVRGKPVNRKVEAAIHGVGILLLFGFAVLVDILQLF